MRHLLVCLPLPTAAQTKSEHFTFAERQALRFGAMSRTTLILIALVLATGCGDSGNPVGPSPTPVLAVPRPGGPPTTVVVPPPPMTYAP